MNCIIYFKFQTVQHLAPFHLETKSIEIVMLNACPRNVYVMVSIALDDNRIIQCINLTPYVPCHILERNALRSTTLFNTVN